MSKFKKGEKVIVIKNYSNLQIGDDCIVDTVDGEAEQYYIRKIGGELSDSNWMNKDEIEKFIEPKFKIGDRFEASCVEGFGKETHVFEIVKVSLNKKKKEYSYLLFSLKNGDAMTALDSELITAKKVVKEKVIKQKVVNFTSKEVEVKMNDILKSMGKDIIIKIK